MWIKGEEGGCFPPKQTNKQNQRTNKQKNQQPSSRSYAVQNRVNQHERPLMYAPVCWYVIEHSPSLISTERGEFAACPARLTNLIYCQII